MKTTNEYYEGLKADLLSYLRSVLTEDFFSDLIRLLHGLNFFNCPASTKYHLSIEHGLFFHSLNVAINAVKLAKSFNSKVDLINVFLAGLLHDIGKCGLYDFKTGKLYPTYVKRGSTFVHSDAPVFFTGVDLGLYYAGRLALSYDIAQAIRSHDGQYIEENHQYAHKQCELTHLVQEADTFCGQMRENKEGMNFQELEEGLKWLTTNK